MIGLGINILASPVALFIGGWQQILHIVLSLILERISLYSRNTSFLTTYSFHLVSIRPPKVNIQTSIEKGLEQNMKSTKKKRHEDVQLLPYVF